MNTKYLLPLLFCAGVLGVCRSMPVARADGGQGGQSDKGLTQVVFGLACQPAGGAAQAESGGAMSERCISGSPIAGAVVRVGGKAVGVTNERGQFAVEAAAGEPIRVTAPAAPAYSLADAVKALLDTNSAPLVFAWVGLLISAALAALGFLLHSVSQGVSRMVSAAETLAHDDRQSRVERALKRDPLRVIAERIADLTGQPVTLDEKAGIVLVTAQPPAWKVVAAGGQEFHFSLTPRIGRGDRRVSIPRHQQADVAAMWRHLAAQRSFAVAVPARARWALVIHHPRSAHAPSLKERVRAWRTAKTIRQTVAFAARAAQTQCAEGELR